MMESTEQVGSELCRAQLKLVINKGFFKDFSIDFSNFLKFQAPKIILSSIILGGVLLLFGLLFLVTGGKQSQVLRLRLKADLKTIVLPCSNLKLHKALLFPVTE